MTLEIRDERGECPYGAYLGGRRVGHAAWVLVRKTVVLPHVRVDAEVGAAGVGSLLLRRAFKDARADGHSVLPWCPYTRRWAQLHPGYADVPRRLHMGERPFVQRTAAAAELLEEMTLNRPPRRTDSPGRS